MNAKISVTQEIYNLNGRDKAMVNSTIKYR